MKWLSTSSLSTPQRITFWFFWGAVDSLMAYDISDFANYLRQSNGVPLSPVEQVFYFTIFPTFVWFILAVFAFVLFKYNLVRPIHYIEFVTISVVVIPLIGGLLLPQANNLYYTAVLLAGGIVGVIIFIQLIYDLKRFKGA